MNSLVLQSESSEIACPFVDGEIGVRRKSEMSVGGYRVKCDM